MILIGVDLGFSGAVAILKDDGSPDVVDMPISTVAVGKRTRSTYDFDAFVGLLDLAETKEEKARVTVVVEDILHMGFRGSLAARAAGMGYGMVRTTCAAYGIRVIAVSPRDWQRLMLSGRAKGKGASRARAEELFPGIDLGPRGSEGRAEALLLAAYGARFMGGGFVPGIGFYCRQAPHGKTINP